HNVTIAPSTSYTIAFDAHLPDGATGGTVSLYYRSDGSKEGCNDPLAAEWNPIQSGILETQTGYTWSNVPAGDHFICAEYSNGTIDLYQTSRGMVRAGHPDKVIFVTGQLFDGDLGGLQGADEICRRHANGMGLANPFSF